MHRQPVATASNYYHPHSYTPQALPGHYHDPAFSSPLGYRPLQVPLQHQHSAEQLSLASAGFHTPNFRPHHQPAVTQPGLPLRTRQQTRRHQQANMAYQEQSPEELAELQKLSDNFEPEVIVSQGRGDVVRDF